MGSERVPVLRLNFVTLFTARFLSPRSAHPIAVVIWAYALRDVHASALLAKIIVGLSKIGDLPLQTNRSPTGPPLDQKNPVIRRELQPTARGKDHSRFAKDELRNHLQGLCLELI